MWFVRSSYAFVLCGLVSLPLATSAAQPEKVFGGGMSAANGEERVLVHSQRTTVTYCVNPIRYDKLQLQTTTSYTAAPDIAGFFQSHIPGAAAAAGSNPGPAAAAQAANAGGNATNRANLALDFARQPANKRAGKPAPQIAFGHEIARLRQAVLQEQAAWVILYQAPILRLSAATAQTSRLVAFSDLALSRVSDEAECATAGNTLEGTTRPSDPAKHTPSHDDPSAPEETQDLDGIIRTYIAGGRDIPNGDLEAAANRNATLQDWETHLVANNPGRTCWSRSATVVGTAVTAQCALAVDIPTDLEAQQHVDALGKIKEALTALTQTSTWSDWAKGPNNKSEYDSLVSQLQDATSRWTAVKSDTDGRTKFESARTQLQPWAARLTAIALVNHTKPGSPYLVHTDVACNGRQSRGKASRIVLSGSDATDPKAPPLAQEIVTIVCPSNGSATYGVGVASREERHFVVAQGRNPGGTAAQSIVDSDTGGQQVPQIGYLGHLSLFGANGHEFHATAGPTFSFADGTQPGLFYGGSYSNDRAGYLSAGWILSRVSQLSGGYSLGDAVTPDVKTPPTRSVWKNAFTVMFTFPVRSGGNDPQPKPLTKCPPTPTTPQNGGNGGGQNGAQANPPATGNGKPPAASDPNCVPAVPPGGDTTTNGQDPSKANPPAAQVQRKQRSAAIAKNPRTPASVRAAAKATQAARYATAAAASH
jgi:hypothetical protein